MNPRAPFAANQLESPFMHINPVLHALGSTRRRCPKAGAVPHLRAGAVSRPHLQDMAAGPAVERIRVGARVLRCVAGYVLFVLGACPSVVL
ncbi:hypothetical protein OH77DRAFT_316522 [Trametes cingulata]|nr:hypothetical protein OH77DRAFT_316522 [Trametes cingulata]